MTDSVELTGHKLSILNSFTFPISYSEAARRMLKKEVDTSIARLHLFLRVIKGLQESTSKV